MQETPVDQESFSWAVDPEEYGLSINHLSVDDLFRRYEEAGFLYREKRQRLEPYWDVIRENWRKMLLAPRRPFLHQVLSLEDPGTQSWGTGAIWMTRPNVVQCHHHASIGNPHASRQAFLGGQGVCWAVGAQFVESWYRPENRFPNRFFGNSGVALGPARSSAMDQSLVAIDKQTLINSDGVIAIRICDANDVPSINAVLRAEMGSLLAAAEQIDGDDLQMNELDSQFVAIGLRRYRNVFLASVEYTGEPLGVAIAYRGPLGLNFSFMENSCRLIVSQSAPKSLQEAATRQLARVACSTYDDCELPFVIFVGNDSTATTLITAGGRRMQSYRRFVWHRSGFADWYRYVARFYSKITKS